jgi:rhodanese-related sulfurtransferase
MTWLAGIALLIGALSLASSAHADHARFGPVLTIDPESARALLARGGVAALDLRPAADFRAGRLPGARSLPLGTLASRLDEVPDDVVILYSDGPIEPVLGAYHLIRPRRHRAMYVLEGGFDAWRQLGYQTERGP